MPLHLHHIGYLVADLAEARERYCQRFGYERASSAIHDPQQTAWVQFLRLPGDSVYVELIAPDGPGSRLSKALAKGHPMHHLCLQTDDIEQECRRLRGTGMTLIMPPVAAVAFCGARVAWLMGRDQSLTELVESPALILQDAAA